jgi:hypothetical protein
MNTPNNQPAFPVPDYNRDSGMTLRDYFAAKAMLGLHYDSTVLLAINELAKKKNIKPEEQVARAAYDMADAMLAERSTPNNQS